MKLEKAILSTLTYSDHFNFPLTKEEVFLRLQSSEPCSKELVFEILNELVKKNIIRKHSIYYHLHARSYLVALRHQNQISSSKLLLRARSLSSSISHLSSNILAIYLTGSLAVSNASGDADIDLMIITKNNRLWTTRLILTIYSTLLGLRRTPNSTSNYGKICLNLYLTPNSYAMPQTRHNLYTAYELIQVVPLYDPHNTHSQLLSSNSWISKYLPNFPLPTTRVDPSSKNLSPLQNWITGLLENLSYRLQLLYMRRKITREYITPHAAFFHPNNPAPKV